MKFVSIPIIVICCYILGEIYKFIFFKKQNFYKLIPMVVSIIGGVFGIVIFSNNSEIICNASNVWEALLIGIISGASSTGTNQMIKQIFNKKEEKYDCY